MSDKELKWAIRKEYDFAFCVILPSGLEVPIGECFGDSAKRNAKDIVDAMNTRVEPKDSLDVGDRSDQEIIAIALDCGFMLSTHYGQKEPKLMPTSDGETLLKFAKALSKPLKTKKEE